MGRKAQYIRGLPPPKLELAIQGRALDLRDFPIHRLISVARKGHCVTRFERVALHVAKFGRTTWTHLDSEIVLLVRRCIYDAGLHGEPCGAQIAQHRHFAMTENCHTEADTNRKNFEGRLSLKFCVLDLKLRATSNDRKRAESASNHDHAHGYVDTPGLAEHGRSSRCLCGQTVAAQWRRSMNEFQTATPRHPA